MKLELSMKESDKKLLVFLGVFVVVVCFGYWGIRPNVKKIYEMKDDMADYEAIQMMNEMKLAELPLLQIDNDNLEENIVSVRSNYFPMMSSDAVDRYFTNMALDYQLNAYDLTITMPEESCSLSPYQYSKKATSPSEDEEDLYDEEDEAAATGTSVEDMEVSGELSDEDEENTIDTGIYAVTVSMRLGGDQADLTRLVHDLSNSEQKLRIRNYSYSSQQQILSGVDGLYNVLENRVLDITIDIYMCEE